MSNNINGYELSRKWFDFCFENPELISPNHSAIYFFAIELCNRLGWKTKFGFPSQMAMDAIGIKKHRTYIQYFRDLVKWGFFTLIQESKNQYSSNIISLSRASALPKMDKALDKAIAIHGSKQLQGMGRSNGSVDKQEINKGKPLNTKTIEFDIFWNLYDKKIGDKNGCIKKWGKLAEETQLKIIEILPEWKNQFQDKQFQPYPATFLNQERWNDEDEIKTNKLNLL